MTAFAPKTYPSQVLESVEAHFQALTDFVRSHMLEPFDVALRIPGADRALRRPQPAHQAVLKAQRQVDLLTPLVADYGRHATLVREVDYLRHCREALRGRSHFDHVSSFLMDRETLKAHEPHWGEEPDQERVGFQWVTDALSRISGASASRFLPQDH